jgi:pyrroline-5-carboxylate reductase
VIEMKKRLGIIGFGNMGSAIALGARVLFEVRVFDKDGQKLSAGEGLKTETLLSTLVDNSDVLVLAVKPQDFDVLLDELKPLLRGQLLISIAAGITTSYIEGVLKGAKVIRVMPNVAVKISASVTGMSRGSCAGNEDLEVARELFEILGKVWMVKEEMIDSITAISGSGPAYIFFDMEFNKLDPLKITVERKNEYIQRLKQAALDLGFEAKMALELAVSTTASSVQLLIETGSSPADLRRMVTSRGGTTEAALKVLVGNGSWSEAAQAARERAKELSRI